ncbi:MAG: glycosyltransferase family 4 protein [Myxococcota bacterium]
MKILQLVSDWKWTGTAEPMLVLMEALRIRGHQVDLVCPQPPSTANRSLWQEASKRHLTPAGSIMPLRRAAAAGDGDRVKRLRGWLLAEELLGPYDIVHCWHSRDHVLAARALRMGLFGPATRGGTKLVRFLSRAERVARWPWNRWLFGRACDGLVCVNDEAVRTNRALRGGRAISVSAGAVDFKALEIRKNRQEMRFELGVPEDAKLIGVVARIQAHRRFDLLLDALSRVVRDQPEIILVVIGRGTHAEEVVRRPVRKMGLEKNVVFAGYRVEDYADMLGALDLFTFLVPGSDGTCRALLQASAMGLPLVGTSRGAIPEIISHGQTGLVVEENAVALAQAWASLLEDPFRLRQMGQAARSLAAERFSPECFATRMEKFYSDLSA